MFNLLSMDLYRVRRGKSVYVCFGILLIATVVCFGMFWLMATPQGQEFSMRIGMIDAKDVMELEDILDGVDSLVMFRQICMDGGMYNVTFGIWVILFVCADFQSGFIKNVMALYENRWNYIGSKIITAGIVSFSYLALHLLFTLMVNRALGHLVPDARWQEFLFYLSWAWLLTVAFSALVILICVLTRSVAAGAVAAVLLGSGVVVMPLYGILNMFHMGEWLEYSVCMTLAMGPGRYTGLHDLYVYVVGAGFLVLYTAITGIVLRRQDI